MYAPLVTDMVNLDEFYTHVDEEGFGTFEFEMGEPFDSLAQLLSVLPPQSADLLPKPLGELMLHPSSPLTPYYPSDFESDANGKRQSWEAIVQIPFIDGQILQDTVQQILDADEADDGGLLTAAERRRNRRGQEHVFAPPGLSPEERQVLEAELQQQGVGRTMPPRQRSPTGGGGGGGARRKPSPRTVTRTVSP